ncbi:MAG: DUF1707 domain-containing protein [Candidatus Dormibacteraeota bacterium]|nr:DUF1707 domain-containing protein [Candidatus Dormibacteraeota bacterium]
MSGDALPPAIRASDAERDATVIRLRNAMAEGRLTLEDFSQRTDTALTALTRDQLAEVVADLPAHAPVAAVPRTTDPKPWVVGVLGSARRSGRWRVGHELRALSVMGDCKIDLRGAVIDSPLITIEAIAIMGAVEVIVPEGVEVVLEGVAIMGNKVLRMSDTPLREGAPVVRVTGFAVMGEIKVRNTPSLMERAWQRLGGLASTSRPPLPPGELEQ